MICETDITRKFNLFIDWPGNKGLNTVIDIDLSRHPGKYLQLALKNVAMKIDDDILATMRSLDSTICVADWSTEGFLFIERAAFTVFNIKGGTAYSDARKIMRFGMNFTCYGNMNYHRAIAYSPLTPR